MVSLAVVDGQGGLVDRFPDGVHLVFLSLMVRVIEQRALQLLQRHPHMFVRRLVQQGLHPREPTVAYEPVPCAHKKTRTSKLGAKNRTEIENPGSGQIRGLQQVWDAIPLSVINTLLNVQWRFYYPKSK